MTTPIPDMPGFFRKEDGSLGFEKPSFERVASIPDSPEVRVIEWHVFSHAAPCKFGYSPTSPQVMAELAKNPYTEFVFCTPASNETHSFNITYLCVPHRREITIHEIEVFSLESRELLHRFPETRLAPSDETTTEDAIIRHILPLVSEYA